MKKFTCYSAWVAFMFLLATISVLAEGVTNAITSAPSLPQTTSQYLDLIIAGVTPVIVTGIYMLVPRVPKFVLPLITPVVGVGLGLLLNWLTKINLGWVDMAKAGALAVFVREVVNQAVTKRLISPPEASGGATPVASIAAKEQPTQETPKGKASTEDS